MGNGNSSPRSGGSHEKHDIYDRLFANSTCVSLFAEFVTGELSIENVIGFIEYYQFSSALKSSGQVSLDISASISTVNTVYMDSDSIPISTINRMNESNNDDTSVVSIQIWKYRFELLCDKYISMQAPYLLNIPFILTKRINNLRDKWQIRDSLNEINIANDNGNNNNNNDDDIDDCYEMMDDLFRVTERILGETMLLIKDAFSRFKNEPSLYQQFLDVTI